jgi:hypothetical protein
MEPEEDDWESIATWYDTEVALSQLPDREGPRDAEITMRAPHYPQLWQVQGRDRRVTNSQREQVGIRTQT